MKLMVATWSAVTLAGLGLAAQTPATRGETTTQGRAGANQTVTLTGCLKPWDSSMSMSGESPSASAGMTKNAQRFVLTNARMGSGAGSSMGSGSTTGTPDTNRSRESGSGTSAMGMSGGAQDMYILMPSASTVNLAQHVNQQVQVMGTVTNDPSRPGATGPTSNTGVVGGTSAAPPAGSTTTGSAGSTPSSPAGRTGDTTTGTTGSSAQPPAGTTGSGTVNRPSSTGAAAMAHQTLTVNTVSMVSKTCS